MIMKFPRKLFGYLFAPINVERKISENSQMNKHIQQAQFGPSPTLIFVIIFR